MWKSVRQYRQDPAWYGYRKWESADWYRQFGRPAYPFGAQRNYTRHVLQGQVRGYEATLFHLAAVCRASQHGTYYYSVAVLTLLGHLPDTAVTLGRLVYSLNTDPLPPRAGPPVYLPPRRKPRMIMCSVDHAFAKSVVTERVVRMTAEAKMGWRLHENQMIGWIHDYKPFDRVVGLAETMADIVGEFPADVWS
ncbi:hypothetical protein [Streptomyces sp. S186]|uniref:hypothetical protein n=1 Tax=Streptomyces sp. S186 TaxID=3434395 RepID=UPI003F66614D